MSKDGLINNGGGKIRIVNLAADNDKPLDEAAE
jgi:hypothetical protein